MKFRVEKYKTVAIQRGKLKEIPDLQIDEEYTITCMTEESYKYLGFLETNKREN